MGKKLEDLFDRVREALKAEGAPPGAKERALERLYNGEKRRESGIRESVRDFEAAPESEAK